MVTVGYVTTTEASEYIAARYTSDDPKRLAWEALEDTNKEVYLLRSVEAINGLPFPGRPTLPTQSYAFPRWPSSVIPEEVKAAQIENALSLSDTTESAAADEYALMRLYGIESVTIGHYSEKLSKKFDTRGIGITSGKAMQLLQPLLRGGYQIG